MALGRCVDRFCFMVKIIVRWAAIGILIAVLCFVFFKNGENVGKNKAKVQIVEKKIEVIKYAEKKKAQIYSRPNAGRADLLELMRQNKL